MFQNHQEKIHFQPLVQSDLIEMAVIDLDPKGRILLLDQKAAQFIEEEPHYLRNGRTRRFTISPHERFLSALDVAKDGTDPGASASVLYPEQSPDTALLQANCLPYGAGRIRVVLFLKPGHAVEPPASRPQLTPREMSVLELLAAGLRRDRIAFALNISLPTVDMHCANLRRKLAARTTSEAVAIATKLDLVFPVAPPP